MNKLLIASAIAFASLAATSLPSHAASVEIVTNDGPNYHHRHDNRHGDWDNHRRHRDCFTKTTREWHHGHKVIREERVCR